MENKTIKPLTLFKAVLAAAILVFAAVPSYAATQTAATAVVTVAPSGHYAPDITVNNQTVREEETVTFDVLASDANTGDTVTLEISQGQTAWLSIVSNNSGNPARMTVTAAPPASSAGRYRVYFRAADNSSPPLSAEKDIFIDVTSGNQAPVITGQDQTVQVDSTLVFTVSAQDPDTGDTVTFSYTNLPAWLSASAASPAAGNPVSFTFTGTPQTADEGECTMTFTATDDAPAPQTASKQIKILVHRFNNAPVLDPIRDKEISRRRTLEFDLTASDADNDTLTFTGAGGPFNRGAALNSSTGKFTWQTSDADAGEYTVHFEVSDGILSDSEDIRVIVNNNDAPVFDYFGDKKVRATETLSFVVTAKDPNGDAVTYSAENLPAGAVFDPATHTFTWTPTEAQQGEYPNVKFIASAGIDSSEKLIWIFVKHRHCPLFETIGDKYGRTGNPVTFTVNAIDPNNDALTYSVSNNPSGSTLTGQVFTWTPTVSPDQAGTYNDVIFTVTDGIDSDTERMWIFISPNTAPVIERIGDKHVIEGRLLSFTVNATDPNNLPLTYSASNMPAGSVFDPSTRTFTWKAATGEGTEYKNIRFSVTNGTDTSHEDIWIFVEKNGAPIPDPLTDKTVEAGNLLTFGISAVDPTGDVLTYTALNLPPGASFDQATRTFSWTPTVQQTGTYKDVTFEISDGTNIVEQRIWVYVVSPASPTISPIGDKYATVGNALTFTVNATDPGGNPLVYSASNLPAGASFDSLTHVFTWTPGAAQVGTYKDVKFEVTNGTYSDSETIWIFVRSDTAPAITIPGDQHVKTGSLLQFGVSGTDPNSLPLTYSALNLPQGAQFQNQVFTWTPADDQAGTYPDVTFTVTNGAASDSKALWIFVNSKDAPEFSQDVADQYGRVGRPISFTVLATDPNSAPLTYSAVNLPPGATFTDQTFRWTPQNGQAGIYKDVRLEVKNTANYSDSDTFWIFVEDNTPPELDFIGTKFGRVGENVTFTISATDLEGDALIYLASNLPAGATFDAATRRFSWTPAQDGTYTGVHFEVSDGISSDSEDISIVVSP